MSVRDPFDEAYAAGVPRPVAAARQATTAEARRGTTGQVSTRARPTATALALGGVVITPDRVLPKGWVVVEDGVIKAVTARKPSGVQALVTDGVILPGLIDLHGHPEFNVFAPWEPPKTFINRGQWRGDPLYQQLVRDPWNRLTKAGTSASVKKGMTRYAEVRAVVAGVTAIQGASKDYPNKAEALVRNVDLLIFGSQVARSTVDFDRLRPDDIDEHRAEHHGRHDEGALHPPRRRAEEQPGVDQRVPPLHRVAVVRSGDRHDPRDRARPIPLRPGGRCGRQARLVAPVQPPPVQRDDRHRGRPRRQAAHRAGGRLDAVGQPQPAPRDEGRGPLPRGEPHRGLQPAARRDGHQHLGRHRRPGRQARTARGRPCCRPRRPPTTARGRLRQRRGRVSLVGRAGHDRRRHDLRPGRLGAPAEHDRGLRGPHRLGTGDGARHPLRLARSSAAEWSATSTASTSAGSSSGATRRSDPSSPEERQAERGRPGQRHRRTGRRDRVSARPRSFSLLNTLRTVLERSMHDPTSSATASRWTTPSSSASPRRASRPIPATRWSWEPRTARSRASRPRSAT